MRILQIHNKYIEKGGEDTVVANEYLLLQQNGHEVELCTFDNHDLEGLSKFSLLSQTLFNRKSYRKVQAHIAAFQPDVVHIHNIYYAASAAIFWAIKRKQIPAVMTIHNYRLGCIQGLLFRDNAVCQLCLDKKSSFYGLKYRCFKNSLLQSLQLTLVNKINQWTIRHLNPVKKYIFLADFTKNLLSPILYLKNTEGVLKPNYVNDFGFTKPSERSDFYLFVGRLNEQKGVKELLAAFKTSGKKLEIIGSGPLEDLVKEAAAMHPNIQYLGYANNAYIIEKLKKSKALIVPSLTYEGQPMTILEAFSTGTPVLAANTKNLDTLIAVGQNGFLFDATQPESLSNALNVFENFHQSDLYHNARQTYINHFSPARNYQQLMAIYSSIL